MPVEWTLVGRPQAARHIAVSHTGAIYALNFDGALYVNEGGGVDTEWKHVTQLPPTTARIAAGGAGLYFIDTMNHQLSVLNIASPNIGAPSVVGTKVALDIAATEDNTLDFATVLALTSPDNVVQRNGSGGIDSRWEDLVQMVHAVKIACSREWIFCLGSDSSDPRRRVLFRSRNGVTDWENLGEVWATVEITAATSGNNTSEEHLYALNNDGGLLPDYSLWRGRLTN